MSDPKDQYVGEGGDGTDTSLPEEALVEPEGHDEADDPENEEPNE